jgi:hypothetical protein
MDRLPSNAVRMISDQGSLRLFYIIAKKGEVGSADLMKMTKLSRKGYYIRTRNMMNAGLIKRREGVFSLTAFGQVIYHACLQIDDAIYQTLSLNTTFVGQENGDNENNKDHKN